MCVRSCVCVCVCVRSCVCVCMCVRVSVVRAGQGSGGGGGGLRGEAKFKLPRNAPWTGVEERWAGRGADCPDD